MSRGTAAQGLALCLIASVFASPLGAHGWYGAHHQKHGRYSNHRTHAGLYKRKTFHYHHKTGVAHAWNQFDRHHAYDKGKPDHVTRFHVAPHPQLSPSKPH